MDFARKHVAPRPELHSRKDFPPDLWEEMCSAGLFGVGIPLEYGGQGSDYRGISVAGQALVKGGNNLGLGLAWLMHQIIARFYLLGQGSGQQHRAYLPDMAQGRITASIAISEPSGGGHPKYLKTTAEPIGTGYRITGEKTFITNAPIAGLFIVFAVVGQEGDRKRFSAFLVPRATPGLTLREPLDLGFLNPCPHGGILLKGCEVSGGDILGRPGSAYEDMALPFREVEDALMMGPVIGGIRAQLNHLLRHMKLHSPPHGQELDFLLGEIESTLCALEVLAYEAAGMLDDAEHPGLLSLLLFSRRIAAETQTRFEAVVSGAGIEADRLYENMTKDLVSTMSIASGVAHIRQQKLGRSLLP